MLPAGEAGPKVDMHGSNKCTLHHWAHPPCTTARQVNLHGQYLLPSCPWLQSCQCRENRDTGSLSSPPDAGILHRSQGFIQTATLPPRHLGPEVDTQHSRSSLGASYVLPNLSASANSSQLT